MKLPHKNACMTCSLTKTPRFRSITDPLSNLLTTTPHNQQSAASLPNPKGVKIIPPPPQPFKPATPYYSFHFPSPLPAAIPPATLQQKEMQKETKFQITDEQIWYIIVSNETRGPLSLRDLDVMLRTNDINSRTFAWKNGMKEWKVLTDIDEMKESILESSKEILEIERKREMLEKNVHDGKEGEAKGGEPGADETIENKDEDPLTILETTVDNLIKKTFHQSQDGKWNIFDEQRGEWVQQDEEPTEQIAKMKNLLFNKLKNELFFEEKTNKRKKPPAQEENKQPEVPLTEQQLAKREKNKKKAKKQAEKKKEKWYNAKINTFIYISGLPLDVTEEELKQFVSKAGVLRIDLNTGKEKIKLYRDDHNNLKGDAAVSYVREESVDIAIENLKDTEIRSGFKVNIEKAQFNQKDDDYKRRQTKKQNLAEKIQEKMMKKKQFSWDQTVDEQGDGLKIVVMKRMLDPALTDNLEYFETVKRDITEEISKMGEIQRIRFYESHPDGVVEVKFKREKDAESCVFSMNGRFFDGREIECDYWDGETDFKRDAGSLLLQQERLAKFGEEIEEKATKLEKIDEEKAEEEDQQLINKHLLEEN